MFCKLQRSKKNGNGSFPPHLQTVRLATFISTVFMATLVNTFVSLRKKAISIATRFERSQILGVVLWHVNNVYFWPSWRWETKKKLEEPLRSFRSFTADWQKLLLSSGLAGLAWLTGLTGRPTDCWQGAWDENEDWLAGLIWYFALTILRRGSCSSWNFKHSQLASVSQFDLPKCCGARVAGVEHNLFQ